MFMLTSITLKDDENGNLSWSAPTPANKLDRDRNDEEDDRDEVIGVRLYMFELTDSTAAEGETQAPPRDGAEAFSLD